jgi:hypothetical protein
MKYSLHLKKYNYRSMLVKLGAVLEWDSSVLRACVLRFGERSRADAYAIFSPLYFRYGKWFKVDHFCISLTMKYYLHLQINTVMDPYLSNEEAFWSGPVLFSMLTCCGLWKEAKEVRTWISFISSPLHFRSMFKEKLEWVESDLN